MKKTLFLLPFLFLLAVSCQRQNAQNNSVKVTPTNQAGVGQNKGTEPIPSNSNTDTSFQDGSKVLANIKATFIKAGAFTIAGQVTENFSQGYTQKFTNNFTGTLVWPQTEEMVNNIHNIVSGANGTEDSTYISNFIVVNNKKFTKITSTGSTPKQGAQGWQADFVVSPLAKKMGTPTQEYKFSDWLVLLYAQDLKFQKQDGDLFEYAIVPKEFKYSEAVQAFNHQGRLPDGNNSMGNESATIVGTVWVNKDFFVIKERINIQRWNDADAKLYNKPKEGTNIAINYANYNQKYSIKEPIATPQLDAITQKIQAGKSLHQIEQEMKQEQIVQDPTKGRDSRRQSDIMQLRSALELYFVSNNDTYPATLSSLASTYIAVIPNAPQPPDGKCTDQQNSYTYTLVSPQSYSLSFCLGVGTNQYGAGVHIANEKGIQ